MNRKRLIRAAAALFALCLAAVATPAAQASGAGGGDWPMWQKDPRGSRHNAAEHRINPKNVGGLKLKWAFAYPRAAGTPRSQPAVVGDTVYFGSPEGKLYARDAATGAAKWEFALNSVPGPGRAQPQDGPAVARGKVYFGDGRGFLYAVSQRTGELVWARRLDEHIAAGVTSSPLVFGDRVYVGVSSGENLFGKENACCTFRGHLNALDADTGEPVWRYYTTPPPVEDGTWPNGVKRFAPSGAGVWSSPAIDPATRTIYVGTGQNYTGSAGNYDSVLAINADTGRPRWTRRMTDVDTWRIECSLPTPEDKKYCPNFPDGTALDFDLGASPNIVRTGKRTLISIGQKSGVYHVLDAKTGKIVWQRQLSTPQPGGGMSGVQWGTSFDGERLYVATWMANPGTLYALDPATGHLIWQTPNPADGCTTGGAAQFPNVCRLGHTPAVTTTPGLVWEGSTDGKMRAYSARTGEVLWTYDTMQDVQGVNGLTGRGGAVSGGGGAVVARGMVYVQSGYFFNPYPNPNGSVFLAFGLP
ncbi:PQQ-binding-like beta-propeller repeat protein [Spongiactinospora sp. TRM90649]|uniref:outer membrane protein assembly factor BamB family protein n=1 Tax=Spongiactinospora sp. TRM90649 TaxID=3031114 RepID=UPI0023F93C2B|nr:PQQ-binding-like beta-propeller repeat protein [Spongiactinospora sp. TRM90649]MDF5751628.1 PQQ-binding-like beta-propeller repeat protein [Spongiactinospora sp. TRM90649]